MTNYCCTVQTEFRKANRDRTDTACALVVPVQSLGKGGEQRQ